MVLGFDISFQGIFESSYEKLLGAPAESFRFVPGATPLSTYREVATIIITYLTVIFGGQLLMKNRKPIQLSLLFQIHNAFLTVLSLGLFVLFIENTLPIVTNLGPYGSICSGQAFTQKLELLYYINYLTKYYELLDTCFLVLRKKNLEFLHWYHHSMTALLCFTQLSGRTSVSWLPITLNLGVHVLMYYYYFLATFNIKVWWKKYITVVQITQFVLDIVAVSVYAYSTFAMTHSHLPSWGSCSGSFPAGLFAALLLLSYLLLFVKFFFKVYSQPKKSPTPKPAT